MDLKICMLTGAGISVPLNLPITNGFTDTIKKIDGRLLTTSGHF